MAAIDRDRAMALVGTPFRAQGRDPGVGLDCVGMVLSACGLPDDYARADYRLRGRHRAELVRGLGRAFRRIGRKEARPGDLVLLAISEDQYHLAILTGRGFVHADASLRKVVETPGDPPWPAVGIFRRRSRKV